MGGNKNKANQSTQKAAVSQVNEVYSTTHEQVKFSRRCLQKNTRGE